jgi:hypothetical protein
MEVKHYIFKNLDKGLIRKLKIICRKMTGEPLLAFPEHKIFIVFNTSDQDAKPIGFCCVSNFSPENHFDNESTGAFYVYNYICDAKYRKLKQSLFLINHIKSLGNDLNLDILKNNEHAKKFFIRNGFKYVKDYNMKKFDTQTIYYESFTYFFQ